MCADPVAAVDDVISVGGISSILSSGGSASAHIGRHVLAAMVHRAAGRISIIAGGGIRADNVADVVRDSGVAAVRRFKKQGFFCSSCVIGRFTCRRERCAKVQ